MSLKINLAALLLAGTLATTFGCSQSPPNGLAPASKSLSAAYSLQDVPEKAIPEKAIPETSTAIQEPTSPTAPAEATTKEESTQPAKEESTQPAKEESTQPAMVASDMEGTSAAEPGETPHKRHHKHHCSMMHVGIKDSIIIVQKGKN